MLWIIAYDKNFKHALVLSTFKIGRLVAVAKILKNVI